MTHYDFLVVGGGTGNNTAMAAAEAGHDTALIEPGPLGGTCLNRGCNPSKMLIQHAHAVNGVHGAERFGIDATLEGFDYESIVSGVNETLGGIAEGMTQGFLDHEKVTLYDSTAAFVGERTVEVDGEELSADRVVVAAGTRPIHPGFIDGIEEVDYLTSDDAIRLTERPDELVIVGGGYIACELGYFFESMGADVSIVEMMDTLIPREDGDVAAEFTEIARERHDVYTGYAASAVSEEGGRVTVEAESEDSDTVEISGDELLVAIGRRPNTDTLDVETGGIETDENGFVETDEHLAASAENVWAQGDIAGNYLFKHTGDYETEVVIDNAVHGEGRAVDYTGVGHAIFTEPEIGGMGPTEEDLQDEGVEYVVGRADYDDTSMARARKIEDGFAKVLASPDGELLGCHVLGDDASDLVHQAIVAKRAGASVSDVGEAIYVHPAMSKVMRAAFADAVR